MVSRNDSGSDRLDGRRSARGSRRFFPSRFDSRYCILTALRQQLESIVAAHFSTISDAVIVDFGSGNAPYRELFTRSVRHYLCIDAPSNASADFHFSASGTSPLPSAYADIVVSTQVLEHVQDPALYLAECYRMLKPGGRLVLSTHGYWPYHGHPDDFWRWTGTGLRKQLEDSQFLVVEVRGLLGLAATAIQLLQDALLARLPSRLHPPLAAVFQLVIQGVDRLSSSSLQRNDACVFIAVAAKHNSARVPDLAS